MVDLRFIWEEQYPAREFSVFVAAEAYPDLRDELLNPWTGLDPECRLPDTPTAAEVEATSWLAQFHPPEPWEDQAGWLDIAASLGLCVSTDTIIDNSLAGRIGKALRQLVAERTEKLNSDTNWSKPRSKSDWVRILNDLGVEISSKTFQRRLGVVYRQHPDTKPTAKVVIIDISTLPPDYSEAITLRGKRSQVDTK